MADAGVTANAQTPLIEVQDLVKHFPVGRGLLAGLAGGKDAVRAVNGVSFQVRRGEILGIAGESGCGKTTTAKMLLKLFEPSSGSIRVDGQDLSTLRGADLKAFRRRAQLMFQNPYESFSPRFTILRSVSEPLIIHGIGNAAERVERVRQALADVHLRPADSFFNKYPHQLSGGQLQRVVLARALVLEPDFLVADEPVSMLDVSVRAGILNTMKELSRKRNLTTIYISHDLSLIQYLCDTTAIMYLGRIAEMGPTARVIRDPQHPYTQALVSAIPIPEPGRPPATIPIRGGIPSAIELPSGCPFHTRCPYVMDVCPTVMPPPVSVGGSIVRCYLHGGREEAEAVMSQDRTGTTA
ncbi:MAG: ABC transporter ATP-binding protein [Chloroflexota bacterium]|nr:ABC transporter ATP-binding protein [Chloroflexota bacterium]